MSNPDPASSASWTTGAGRLRFALCGAGFWARYQLAAWRELDGVECVAICDPALERAEALARQFGVPRVERSPEPLLSGRAVDFIDIVSAIESHAPLVHLAARHRTAAICQKPMAATLDEARGMVRACRQAGVPLFVHENFRWQRPILAVRDVLRAGRLGAVLRARLDFISGFPVFDNQPALRALPRMILTDVGVHTLDVVRFLFGEADSVACRTQRVRPDIAGEDVATVMLGMRGGATVLNCLAYAGTPLERDAFPQPLLFIEGDRGSLVLGPGCELRVTTAAGTEVTFAPPDPYPWVDPAYAVVQSSIVACNRSFRDSLRGTPLDVTGATTGADNFETLRLVEAAYLAADTGAVIPLRGEHSHDRLARP